MALQIADNTHPQSLSTRFRQKRFQFFLQLISTLPRPLRILDIGGTQAYWDMMGFAEPGVHVVLLNLTEQPITDPQRFSSVAGDATNLGNYPNQSFDMVYSNSVIEHLFDFTAQQAMAKEVQRVGKAYFIQTPNYYFPIEPHWVFPFFQFFPQSLKIWLTRHFALGHIGQIQDKYLATQQVKEIQLLHKGQMRELFLEGNIYEEMFFGLVKSISAYKI